MERIKLIPVPYKVEDLATLTLLARKLYKEREIERSYYNFLLHTLKDAENRLTKIVLILFENEIIGFSAISTSTVEVFETETRHREISFQLYADWEYLPAVQIDLFLLIKSFRRQRLGYFSFKELLKYIFRLHEEVGFRFITTLSTNKVYTNLVKKFGFTYLLREIDEDELVERVKYNNPFIDESNREILIEEAKEAGFLKGVWLYADLLQLEEV